MKNSSAPLKGSVRQVKLPLVDALKIVQNMRDHYSEDIFNPDGETAECKAAKLARLVCDNIAYDLIDFAHQLDAGLDCKGIQVWKHGKN